MNELARLNDLEYALKTSPIIQEKCCNSIQYCRHLYFAMCNIEWQYEHEWFILKDEWWSCSWRYAGSIVADIRGEGDYIDYYAWRPDASEIESKAYDYGSSLISSEVESDLKQLGFRYRDMED